MSKGDEGNEGHEDALPIRLTEVFPPKSRHNVGSRFHRSKPPPREDRMSLLMPWVCIDSLRISSYSERLLIFRLSLKAISDGVAKL